LYKKYINDDYNDDDSNDDYGLDFDLDDGLWNTDTNIIY